MADPSVAVVTGGASGMGFACAQRLVGRGGVVILADLSPAVEDAAVALRAGAAPGTEVRAVRGDLTDPDAALSLAKEVASLGRLRSVVQAAGVSPTMGDWKLMFTVDLVATALVLNAMRPLASTSTVAVCFASSAGHQLSEPRDATLMAIVDDPLAPDLLERLGEAFFTATPDTGAAYSWAKRGVISLVERQAAAWGAVGARICSVSPGIIDTPMGRLEMANQPMMPMMIEHTPLHRAGTADEVAGVVDFLLSDQAAYMTGCDVLIDGGVVPTIRRAFA